MKPFYFNVSNRKIFAIYHPPESQLKQKVGILLCYPFGQEYIRAHRSFVNLSRQLSRRGFPVLRFDYSGTGDSQGDREYFSFKFWEEDLSGADRELKQIAHVNASIIVGLRLGATLALKSTPKENNIVGLVLWDPVLKGLDYLNEIQKSFQEWLLDMHPKSIASIASLENFGFSLPDSLVNELSAIDLLSTLGGIKFPTLLVSSETMMPHDVKIKQFINQNPNIEYHSIQGIKPWIKYEGLDKILVPAQIISLITDWIAEQCRTLNRP